MKLSRLLGMLLYTTVIHSSQDLVKTDNSTSLCTTIRSIPFQITENGYYQLFYEDKKFIVEDELRRTGEAGEVKFDETGACISVHKDVDDLTISLNGRTIDCSHFYSPFIALGKREENAARPLVRVFNGTIENSRAYPALDLMDCELLMRCMTFKACIIPFFYSKNCCTTSDIRVLKDVSEDWNNIKPDKDKT